MSKLLVSVERVRLSTPSQSGNDSDHDENATCVLINVASYAQLVQQVSSTFSIPADRLVCKYMDDDADVCRITSADELREAVRLADGAPLHLMVSDTSDPEVLSSDPVGSFGKSGSEESKAAPVHDSSLGTQTDAVQTHTVDIQTSEIGSSHASTSTDQIQRQSIDTQTEHQERKRDAVTMNTQTDVSGIGENVTASTQTNVVEAAEAVCAQTQTMELGEQKSVPAQMCGADCARIESADGESNVLFASTSPSYFFQLMSSFFSDPRVHKLLSAHDDKFGVGSGLVNDVKRGGAIQNVVDKLVHLDATLCSHPFVQTLEVDADRVIHSNIACDMCNVFPIVGIRWKCLTCRDFDLCAACELKQTHDPTHILLKLKRPDHNKNVPVKPNMSLPPLDKCPRSPKGVKPPPPAAVRPTLADDISASAKKLMKEIKEIKVGETFDHFCEDVKKFVKDVMKAINKPPRSPVSPLSAPARSPSAAEGEEKKMNEISAVKKTDAISSAGISVQEQIINIAADSLPPALVQPIDDKPRSDSAPAQSVSSAVDSAEEQKKAALSSMSPKRAAKISSEIDKANEKMERISDRAAQKINKIFTDEEKKQREQEEKLLHKHFRAITTLEEFGFVDRARNLTLLQQHKGRVEVVIEILAAENK